MTYRIDRRKLRICILPGMVAGIGLNLSLTKQVTFQNSMADQTSTGLDITRPLQVVMRSVYLSMSSDRLAVFLAVCGSILLLYMTLVASSDKRMRIWGGIYAALFAVVQLLGESFDAAGSLYRPLDAIYRTPANIVRSVIRLSGWFLIAYALFIVSVNILIRFEQRPADEAGRISGAADGTACPQNAREPESGRARKGTVAKWSIAERMRALPPRRRYAADWCILSACWLPYYVIFWPGTSNEDTVIQLMEYYHYRTYITILSSVQGPDIYITNHHPYLLTLLFGKFADLGLALGDLKLGIGLYCLLHMLFMAAVLAGGLAYLRSAGVARRRVNVLEVILCVVPLFPLYAVCMVKDNLFAEFALLFMLMMAETARTNGEFLSRWHSVIWIAPVALMMMLTKSYGMYMLLIIAAFWLIRYRKAWRQILVGIVVPALFYQCIWTSVLLPAWNVAPGGVQEALSVPFQQTARYVSVYAHEVTDEEKEAISGVLDYDTMKASYDPDYSDNIKNHYNQFATDAQKQAYFRAWRQMFGKHPGVYFAATFDNIDQYLDVDKTSNLFYYGWDGYLTEDPDHSPDVPKASWLIVENLPGTATARYVVHQVIMMFQKIPVINLINSMGIMPWIVLFLLLYNLLRHNQGWNIALLIPLLTYAVCFVSPDNGNTRYILPAVYTMPFLFLLILGCPKKSGLRESKPAEGQE